MSRPDDWGFPRREEEEDFGIGLGAEPGAESGAFEAQMDLKGELDPGEKLIWSGRPEGGRMWLSTLPLIIFWDTLDVIFIVLDGCCERFAR
jgi:hypothetical protein